MKYTEKQILCAILIHGSISGIFEDKRNALIMEVMLDLHCEALPIDLVTVADRLGNNNQLEKIGGASYLAKLVDEIPLP
jgi:replicative DNA helicase